MKFTEHDCPHTSEVPHSRAGRPEYSPEQIAKYVAYIDLPEEYATSPLFKDRGLAQQEDHALPFLGALMRHHAAKIPFENLAIHYSQGRSVTLDLDELYERMLDGCRGGYCFQQNLFFGTILRGIGFEVMNTAARVSSACQPSSKEPNYPGPSYDPWNHMINIVTIGSRDYLVDVGMHAWGPIVPLELKSAETISIAPRTVRLVRGCIPEHVSRRDSNQMWHFEVRHGDAQPWVPTYCFTLFEFLPVDFYVLNWYVSTNKASWFTQRPVCGKLLLSGDGTKVEGEITLFGSTLVKRLNGDVKETVECKSEAHRIELLEKYFGIKLSSYDRKAITGTSAQIL